ncbi:hypothetical protein BH10BAC3_BH10BAC3_33460 [soil metagenome]
MLASILTLLAFVSYSQVQIKDTKLKQGLESVTGEPDISPQGIVNNSFIAANGERFLRFEIVVNTTINETWKMIATEAGIKKWMAPVANLDLRIGGMLQTNYNETAKIDDKGTIMLGIINYIPSEILTYKITLNELFAENCRKEDKNLQHIIQLKSVGQNKTKIISTMAGWGQGKEWDEAYNFFEKGNKWTFQKLLNAFKE